jgi:hypothetical protein
MEETEKRKKPSTLRKWKGVVVVVVVVLLFCSTN